MKDLTTRINENGIFHATKIGFRIKIKLAVKLPKQIYSRQVFINHTKKVMRLASKSETGSLKKGVYIPDDLDAQVIIFNYIEALQLLMAENEISYDMIKI